MGNFKEDIARVKLIVMDVDGVLTNGEITITPEGEFIRSYNAKDGFALSFALKRGYHLAIITGGRGAALKTRFDMLGITHVYMNCFGKIEALHELIEKIGVTPQEVMYIGDDIPDVEPMMYVGMPVCPADAATEVINASRYVSQFKGGEGCVRDVIEQVMRAQDNWYKPGEVHIQVASR